MEEAASNFNGAKVVNPPILSQIPIVQLSPNVTSPASIKAVVALIWPYSSLSNSTTLLLADPNFRLRRDGGQVRVQFSGSSGKAVAESGIGSGDAITLNLEGVEWLPKDPAARIPGRSIEWELKYSERLLMEVCSEETQESTIIDVDHPTSAAAESVPEEQTVEPQIVDSEIIETPTLMIPRSRKISEVESENPEEWQSPAFIKRARTSYGSLFGSSDIFAEDDTGKSRRRSKLGWRYMSRSPSPTPSIEVEAPAGEVPVNMLPETPAMTDEGCQTSGDADALPDIPQFSAEPNFNASTLLIDPLLSTSNEVNTNANTQTQSEDLSFQEDIDMQHDWTAVNLQPRDQKSNFGSEQRQNEKDYPVLENTDLYNSAHAREDEHEQDVAQNEVMHDELVDTRVGFEDGLQSPNQYENWQRNMSNDDDDQLAGLPHQPLEYPSPTHHSMGDLGHTIQPYEGVDHTSKFYQDGVETQGMTDSMAPDVDNAPRKLSISSHHSSTRQTPSLLPPSDSVSRAQSAAHEVLDLTGSSDEEENDANDEDALGEDESVEGSNNVNDAEDEGDYETRIPSWKRGYQTDVPEGHAQYTEDEYSNDGRQRGYESGYDDEEADEEGDEYDRSDDEDDEVDQISLNGTNAAPGGETAVISLLSSDDEDEGDKQHVAPLSSVHTKKSLSRPARARLLVEHSDQSEDDSGESEDEYESEDNQETGRLDPRQLSRAVVSRDDDDSSNEGEDEDEEEDVDLSDQENVAPLYLSRARSSEQFSDDPRRQSHMSSYDGASDQVDEMVVESRKATPLPTTKASIDAYNDIYPQLEKKSPKPTVATSSKTSLPNETESSEIAATETQFEEAISDKTKLVKAQILEILSEARSAAQSDDVETEGSVILEPPLVESNIVAEDHVADKMDITMEEQTTVISAVLSEELIETRDAADKMEITTEQETVVTDTSSPRETLEALKSETLPTEEDVTNNMEIIVEEESIVTNVVSTNNSIDALDNPETTEEPLYPQLPLVQEDVPVTHGKFSASRAEISENEQRPTPTPEDTQMTNFESTVSFEATQSSVNDTQLTEFTSVATSFEEVKPNAASTLLHADATEITETISDSTNIKTSQVDQGPITTNENNTIGGVEKEAEESLSKVNKVEVVIEVDPSTKPPPLPVTPRRSQRQASKALNSPKPTITPQKFPLLPDEIISPEGYDPSAELVLATYASPSKKDTDDKQDLYDASIELALATLASPSKKDTDNSSPSTTASNQAHLKRSLRTDRGEYTVLKNLRIKANQKRDILAIATTTSSDAQQAKKPPKHWLTDFNVTDPSVSGSVVTRVAVFRPHATALPIVNPGDGILLRNFKIQTQPNVKFSLRSENDSSWAVLKADGSIEERGPPVEAGEEEFTHLAELKTWFEGMSATQKEVLNKAHNHVGDKGKGAKGSK